MKTINQHQAHKRKTKLNGGPKKGTSLTVPGESYSIKEIAHQYEASGVLSQHLFRSGEFLGDDISPFQDPENIDIVDHMRIAKESAELIKKAADDKKQAELAIKEKKRLDHIQEKAQELLKAQEKQESQKDS